MEDQFRIYEEYDDEDYQKVEGNPHLLKEKNTGYSIPLLHYFL